MSEKYRSKKRYQPRIMNPLGINIANRDRFEEEEIPEPIDPALGVLTFSRHDHAFSKIFSEATKNNEIIIQEYFSKYLGVVEASIDAMHSIASEFFWIINHEPYAELNSVTNILRPSFEKNLVILSSALAVTKMGLYSSARPMLRHVFESLMISKFCSTNSDSEIYDKWLDGKIIYFSNGVLKKIKKPEIEVFQSFWEYISEFSHPSPYSMQPNFHIQRNLKQVGTNITLMMMLCECNYHLLNSHLFTRSLRYYHKRYNGKSDLDRKNEFIKEKFALARELYSKECLNFVRNYKSKWVVV